MRRKKTLINILVSLLLQLTTIICGIIIPRMIIETFGSAVNGAITSIIQFLAYIALIDGGSGVFKSVLYKPLAEGDSQAYSRVVKATENFFRVVAFIFVGYLALVAVFYPLLVKNEFGWYFTFSLVLIMSISLFFQFYFGITYQILLEADQKMWITSLVQIGTLVVNTLLVIILIKVGTGIHLVMLGSASVYIMRPLIFNMYVKHHYTINRNCEPDKHAVKQRWDGFGHHIANIIHANTDVLVLTIFTNLREVSVYSVYLMPITGVVGIIKAVGNSISASLGNAIAKNDKEALNRAFNVYELLNFIVTAILFSVTSIQIVPFVGIYTTGITDVVYYRPLFAYFLVLAQAVYCLRNPSLMVILAAGHFKQTKNAAYCEAIINIILSLIFVNMFGIIGVAIGTFVAMVFRTIHLVWYLSKNIMNRGAKFFVQRCLVNGSAVGIVILLISLIPRVQASSFYSWALQSGWITLIASGVVVLFNYFFYKQDFKELFSMLRMRSGKEKSVLIKVENSL